MVPTRCHNCGEPYPANVLARLPRPPKDPKAYCLLGHERTPENLNGNNSCRICHKLKMQARNQVHREGASKRGITIAEYLRRYGNSMGAAEYVIGKDRIIEIFKASGLYYA